MMSRIFESRFFEVLAKIVDIILLGLYWLILSIPIITIGATTTALYYAVHKCIYQSRGYTTEFFRSFKSNFKQSTLSWLIFLVIGGICATDIYATKTLLLAGERVGNMWILFVIIFAIEIVWAIYHFAYVARFENSFKESLKLSGAFMILHFPTSIAVLAITVFFGLLCYTIPVFLILIPGIYMVCIHPLLERVFRKYMSEEDRELENSYR